MRWKHAWETEDAQARTDIIAACAAHGKSLEGFALADDCVGIIFGDFYGCRSGDMKVEVNQLGFGFRSEYDLVHHPALKADLRA
jgi:hypothetical protein